jgi:hypothetical protein
LGGELFIMVKSYTEFLVPLCRSVNGEDLTKWQDRIAEAQIRYAYLLYDLGHLGTEVDRRIIRQEPGIGIISQVELNEHEFVFPLQPEVAKATPVFMERYLIGGVREWIQYPHDRKLVNSKVLVTYLDNEGTVSLSTQINQELEDPPEEVLQVIAKAVEAGQEPSHLQNPHDMALRALLLREG